MCISSIISNEHHLADWGLHSRTRFKSSRTWVVPSKNKKLLERVLCKPTEDLSPASRAMNLRDKQERARKKLQVHRRVNHEP